MFSRFTVCPVSKAITIALLGMSLLLTGCVYHVPREPLPQGTIKVAYDPLMPGFPPVRNYFIERELQHFTQRDPNFIPQALSRKEPLWDEMREIFIEERMPLELISVAVVESGFEQGARSPRGAAGLWQFTRPTAEAYGLSVGMFRDQRYDPAKSTRAALLHLRDLYQRYNDWNLALAAYNAGPGLVDRICREEGTTDFWKLLEAQRFPVETRRYVPKVLAASILLQKTSLDFS